MIEVQYILERLDTMEKKFDAKLDSIEGNSVATLVQTTKTNGRVGRLEEWKTSTQKIISKTAWVLVGAVVALIVFYIQNYISKH